MSATDQAIEAIYTSVNGNNENLDAHIGALKQALGDKKEIVIDPAKLVHNNRESRKRMQAYFRQKGVKVEFSK